MRRIVAASLISLASTSWGITNLPAPQSFAVMTDTNGVLTSPAAATFRDSNNLAQATALATLSSEVVRVEGVVNSNQAAIATWTNQVAGDQTAQWVYASNLSAIGQGYAESAAVHRAGWLRAIDSAGLVYGVTQTWDFTTSAWSNDFDLYATQWETGKGVKIHGPPWSYYDVTNAAITNLPRVMWTNTPMTGYAYRITFALINDDYEASNLTYCGIVMVPNGQPYTGISATSAYTYVVTVTNDMYQWSSPWLGNRIAWIRDKFYEALHIQSLTIESAYLTSTQTEVVAGSMVPDFPNAWDVGSPSRPLRAGYFSSISNHWKLVAVPTASTASGASGEMAWSDDGSTNYLYWYSPSGRWIRVGGVSSWP